MSNSEYPAEDAYVPLHPALKGVAVVRSSHSTTTYDVDLGRGTCTCNAGRAWRWSNNKWVPNNWCSHKLKVAASLIEHTTDRETKAGLQAAYNRLLGEKYIVWESVSAFHKELRRGDKNLAQYWALSVAAHRGLNGVVRYMLNILFEESRDIELYSHLIDLAEKGRNVTYKETMAAVRWFCAAPKKWELPGRLDIFLNEMRGYKQLVRDYGAAVAKPKEIIETSEYATLYKSLIAGFVEADPVQVQVGLKGLYKSKYKDGHKSLVISIYNALCDCLNGELGFSIMGNKFKHDHKYASRVQRLIYRRYATFGDIGYHDLNALADALQGEHYPTGQHLTPARTKRAILVSPALYTPPMGRTYDIPLYALDNHNHRGKHLMAKWGASELQPGAEQEHIDFRWCGAYMGVAWRYLAYDQRQSCEIPWRLVRWYPTWLHGHLTNMWY